jgi:hypothetical protein
MIPPYFLAFLLISAIEEILIFVSMNLQNPVYWNSIFWDGSVGEDPTRDDLVLLATSFFLGAYTLVESTALNLADLTIRVPFDPQNWNNSGHVKIGGITNTSLLGQVESFDRPWAKAGYWAAAHYKDTLTTLDTSYRGDLSHYLTFGCDDASATQGLIVIGPVQQELTDVYAPFSTSETVGIIDPVQMKHELFKIFK